MRGLLSALILLSVVWVAGSPSFAQNIDAPARGLAAAAKIPTTCNTSATVAGIQNCISLLETGGQGGVVHVAGGPIPVNTNTGPVSITGASGIFLEGAPVALPFSGSITEQDWSISGGSYFACSGAGVSAITGNTASKGSPDSPNYLDNAIGNGGIENFGFSGCANSIVVGGQNNFGLAYYKLSHLFTLNTQAGYYAYDLINFHHLVANDLHVNDAGSVVCAAGGIRFMQNLDGVLNEGNSQLSEIVYQGRGACFTDVGIDFQSYAPNTTAIFDLISGGRLQSINFRNTQLVEAISSIGTGSTCIGVASAAVFPVNMPVTISTTEDGFTQNQTYFVLSSGSCSANGITLGNSMSGSAITPTGSTVAGNITSYGMPHIRVVGLASGGGNSTANNMTFQGIDCEGKAQVCLYAENSNNDTFDFATTAGLTQGTMAGVGTRAVQGLFVRDTSGNSYDVNSTVGFNLSGSFYSAMGPTGATGCYYLQSVSTTGCTYGLTAAPNSLHNLPGLDFVMSTPGGGELWRPLVPGTAIRTNFLNASSQNLLAAHCGSIVNTNTAAVTLTLPTIGDMTSSQLSTYNGCFMIIDNNTAFTATVQTTSTDTFNNITSDTSIAVPAFSGVLLIAQQRGLSGANRFWEVTPLRFLGQTTTVANLPTCTSTMEGMRMGVSDATSPTWHGALTGSGTVHTSVECLNGAWVAD